MQYEDELSMIYSFHSKCYVSSKNTAADYFDKDTTAENQQDEDE